MAHKNVKDLKKAILSKAKKGVEAQLPTVRRKMQESIKKVVYDAYNPIQYERRGFGNGGLGDSENIVGNIVNEQDNSFGYKVENVAMPKYEPQAYLAPLIILGQTKAINRPIPYPVLYRYGSEFAPYGQARDFISDTEKRLDKGEIASNLERHMKR